MLVEIRVFSPVIRYVTYLSKVGIQRYRFKFHIIYLISIKMQFAYYNLEGPLGINMIVFGNTC